MYKYVNLGKKWSPVGKRKKGAEDEILNLPKNPKKAKLTIFMVWKNMRDN